MRSLLRILILTLWVALVGCSQSNLATDSSQTVLADNSYYLGGPAITRVFWKNAGLGTFITILSPVNGKLLLPKSITTGGEFGNRSAMDFAANLDLMAQVYYPNHPSGDIYFEAPILGPQVSVSNVTTALSWYLRYGFGNVDVKMSQETFDKLVLNIEVVCDTCRKKTSTQVLELIRSNSNLENVIRSAVYVENKGTNFNGKVWVTPKPTWVWSDPVLSSSIGIKQIRETESLTLTTIYVNPMNSTKPIYPQKWLDAFSSTYINSNAEGKFFYTMTNDDAGTHNISPHFNPADNVPDDDISFHIAVDDTNRVPLCVSPLVVNMRANVLNTVELNSFCSDPDPDNTFLTYTLESGPSGGVITSTGSVRWTPPSQGAGFYEVPFSFRTVDAKSGLALSSGTISVAPDKFPTFTSIDASYNFVEGSEGSFTVTAKDDDGDPLKLSIIPQTALYTGYPSGAGNIADIIRTGTDGNYSFQVRFTPSYLQTIGTDGVLKVKLLLSYDNAGGGAYDQTLNFDEQLVDFNVTNVDDPPTWTLQPTDQVAIEGTDIGGVLIGAATDPNPNPTAVSYSVTSTSDSDRCSWASLLSVTESAGQLYLYGVPPYYTSTECSFRINATDARELATSSQSFVITTSNTNQAIALCSSSNGCSGNPITTITGREGALLSWPLTEIFSDPDIQSDPSDEREFYTYACSMDLDNNGSYETDCLSVSDLALVFSTNTIGATSFPKAGSARTYRTRLTVTDVGGTSATHDFDVVVTEYPTPMELKTYISSTIGVEGTEGFSFSVSEGQTYYLTLKATAATGRPIDIYDYNITPSCAMIGGAAPCSVNMLQVPAEMSANGTASFVFTIAPNYTDADSTYPTTSKNFAVNFYVQKADNAEVYSQTSVYLQVQNTNRDPTNIELTKSTFGCTGSTDVNDSPFVICINGAADTKVGANWTKTYSIPLLSTDPDGANGSYSYTLDPLLPGTVANDTLSIKLPSCAYSSTGTLLRTYSITLSDGYGGTYVKPVQLRVQRMGASASCM